MSSALINDYPITFLPHLAKAIGVNEALVLQQLHYWLVNHAEVQHEGKFWIYKTYEEWQEQDFFFWSVRTVKSVFKNLTNLGLIESKKLSSNRHNRVNYYTINAEKLAEISVICEAEFEQKRLLKLAKNGVKVCTFDSAEVAQSDDANFAQSDDANFAQSQSAEVAQSQSAEVAQSQSAEVAQSQSAEVAQCLREQEENNKEKREESNAPAQNSEIDLSLTEKPTAIETFEFLKQSLVFGAEFGVISEREPNLAEINALVTEVDCFWSNKHLTKKQLLGKILSAVGRLSINDRLSKYTVTQSNPTDAPVVENWDSRQGEQISDFVAPLPMKGFVR